MQEVLADIAHRLRASTTEPARVCLRGEMAAAIRRLANDRLRAQGVPADVADDEANYLAFELVRRVERGLVQPGAEAAYVRRSAANRANDYYRHSSGVRGASALGEEEERSLADDRTPESLMTEHQDAADLAVRVARLRALIASAPPGYAAVLHEVYVRGTLIDSMARAELELRIERGDELGRTEAALKKARATVDQRLHRAREWIRAQLGVESHLVEKEPERRRRRA